MSTGRQPMHIASEVNSGKKDVSFLPRGFDVSLLTDEKRAEFEKFNKGAVGTETDETPKTKTKRGGAAQDSPNA